MADTTKQYPVADKPYRPWRLIALVGWLLLILIHYKAIPGVELSIVQKLIATVGLIVFSWFAMPNRRAELLGFSALLAILILGSAGDFSIGQVLVLIGLVMLLTLGYALWLLRHSSLRLRLIVIGVFLAVAALEIFAAGFESLVEMLASAG